MTPPVLNVLITVVKAARIDQEFLEKRQVTIRDVTAKIKKRKRLFVKSCNRRCLIYNAKEVLKLAVRLKICIKVLGYDVEN